MMFISLYVMCKALAMRFSPAATIPNTPKIVCTEILLAFSFFILFSFFNIIYSFKIHIRFIENYTIFVIIIWRMLTFRLTKSHHCKYY